MLSSEIRRRKLFVLYDIFLDLSQSVDAELANGPGPAGHDGSVRLQG